MIAQVTAGHRDAFRLLVERYGALAQRTAVLLGAGADADDVVQEAFVRAFRALPQFRAGEPFRPWLLRIVVNQAHNAGRARWRARSALLRAASSYGASWYGGSGFSEAVADDPADTTLSRERRRQLLAALATLKLTDREVLVLRYLLDLSEAETAAALGLAAGTVKSRTARALQRMRAALDDERRVGVSGDA